MKKILISILFLFQIAIVHAQDTTYLDQNSTKVKSIEKAKFYEVVTKNPDNKGAIQKIYFISGQAYRQISYSNLKKRERDGKFMEWFENGVLKTEIDFKKGFKDGQFITYWPNSKTKRFDTFENNKLISGKCFNEEGEEVNYFDYERAPIFPSGPHGLNQYISSNLVYPVSAKAIEGTVVVKFVVSQDGSITDVSIKQSVDTNLDREALRVVKNMPKWLPGLIDGNPVNVYFNIPIKFKLN